MWWWCFNGNRNLYPMSKQIHVSTVHSFRHLWPYSYLPAPLHSGYLADIGHKKRQQPIQIKHNLFIVKFVGQLFLASQPCHQWSLTKTVSTSWRQGSSKDRKTSSRSRTPLPLQLQDFYAEYLKGDPKSEADYRTQRFVELALKEGIPEKKTKRALSDGKVFPTSFYLFHWLNIPVFPSAIFIARSLWSLPSWISMSTRGSTKTWHPRPSCLGDASVASSSNCFSYLRPDSVWCQHQVRLGMVAFVCTRPTNSAGNEGRVSIE